MQAKGSEVAFGPLVETCKAHGISRTVAFELARKGDLKTFSIGARRYVLLASLHALPERLAPQAGES